MSDRLEIATLIRPAEPGKKARRSVDFLVNCESLFTATEAKNADMCGRFSSDFPENNPEAAEIFTLRRPADLKSGRSMLYVCPECGDIGCGAITVRISDESGNIVWSAFAYENDYEEPRPICIGPFKFPAECYAQVIAEARDA